jgi:aspartate ammonia-lyase
VYGNDAAVLAAGNEGQLELNVMMPVIAWNAVHATMILGRAITVLDTHCVRGIKANAERARELLDRSTAVATALSPHIGYARTAEIAKLSIATGRPIRDIVREQKLLPDAVLDSVLSPEAMTTPGRPGASKVLTTRKKQGRTRGRTSNRKGARNK